jgi:flavocytochrome c
MSNESKTARRMSRREFVKGAAVGAGAVTGLSALAGCSSSAGSAPASGAPEKWDREVDVVFVGAGTALLGAVKAADLGAKVILLERAPVVGGSTAMSGGVIYAAETSIQAQAGVSDSKDVMFEDWMKGTRNEADPELVRIVADRAAEVVDWFAENGADYPTEPDFLYQSGPDPVRRGHTVKERIGGSYSIILERVAKEKGVEILLEHRAMRLFTDGDGRVVGIQAVTTDGEIVNIGSKAVVLGTGGFCEDPDMLRQYYPISGKDVWFGAPGTCTGDGIRAAQVVGADLTGTHQFYEGLGCVLAIEGGPERGLAGLKLINQPVSGFPPTFKQEPFSYVIVNKQGRRFVSDVEFYMVIVGATYGQEGAACYFVFDESMKADERFTMCLAWTREEFLSAIDEGWVKKASTLRELAESLGVDPDGLEETVEEYNRYADAGEDEDFGRYPSTLKALETGPFYGVTHRPGMNFHGGGLRVNAKMQVLRRDREPIPGLYASGTDIGGLITMGYPGSGSMLASGFVSSLVAGENAAAE